MERAPKFTPQGNESHKSEGREVEELKVVSEALEANLLKLQQRGEQPTFNPENLIAVNDNDLEDAYIGQFDPSAANLDPDKQEALRETLSRLQSQQDERRAA